MKLDNYALLQPSYGKKQTNFLTNPILSSCSVTEGDRIQRESDVTAALRKASVKKEGEVK